MTMMVTLTLRLTLTPTTRRELTLTKTERRWQKEVQEGARPDIQARLRRAPGVIVMETWANRAQRTRVRRDIFQAGTKKGVKKPGRGRKDR